MKMNTPVMAQTPISFRISTITFSVILGLLAAWLLSIELIRFSSPIFFPSNKTDVEYTAAQRDRAAAAARLGWLRGDLWADYALIADGQLLNAVGTPAGNNKIELVSERALGAAPYDARLWLLSAAINAQLASTTDRVVEQLKMSFYTSPNDIRLSPLRLRIAARLDPTADDELQNLIEHELRTALQKPELKPMIATAYREASPATRQFIQAKLAVLDPKFSSELRALGP